MAASHRPGADASSPTLPQTTYYAVVGAGKATVEADWQAAYALFTSIQGSHIRAFTSEEEADRWAAAQDASPLASAEAAANRVALPRAQKRIPKQPKPQPPPSLPPPDEGVVAFCFERHKSTGVGLGASLEAHPAVAPLLAGGGWRGHRFLSASTADGAAALLSDAVAELQAVTLALEALAVLSGSCRRLRLEGCSGRLIAALAPCSSSPSSSLWTTPAVAAHDADRTRSCASVATDPALQALHARAHLLLTSLPMAVRLCAAAPASTEGAVEKEKATSSSLPGHATEASAGAISAFDLRQQKREARRTASAVAVAAVEARKAIACSSSRAEFLQPPPPPHPRLAAPTDAMGSFASEDHLSASAATATAKAMMPPPPRPPPLRAASQSTSAEGRLPLQTLRSAQAPQLVSSADRETSGTHDGASARLPSGRSAGSSASTARKRPKAKARAAVHESATDAARRIGGGSGGWTCAQCTYRHEGGEIGFLSCAVCSSQRPPTKSNAPPRAGTASAAAAAAHITTDAIAAPSAGSASTVASTTGGSPPAAASVSDAAAAAVSCPASSMGERELLTGGERELLPYEEAELLSQMRYEREEARRAAQDGANAPGCADTAAVDATREDGDGGRRRVGGEEGRGGRGGGGASHAKVVIDLETEPDSAPKRPPSPAPAMDAPAMAAPAAAATAAAKAAATAAAAAVTTAGGSARQAAEAAARAASFATTTAAALDPSAAAALAARIGGFSGSGDDPDDVEARMRSALDEPPPPPPRQWKREELDEWLADPEQSSITLDADQRRVVELACRQGKSVFYTGPGGVGKSHVTSVIVSFLRCVFRAEFSKAVAITAPTGIAATHIGGTTIHSAVGVGVPQLHDDFASRLSSGQAGKGKQLALHLQVLLIDEVCAETCPADGPSRRPPLALTTPDGRFVVKLRALSLASFAPSFEPPSAPFISPLFDP